MSQIVKHSVLITLALASMALGQTILTATPTSLSLIIPTGRMQNIPIEICNSSTHVVTVDTEFDTSWIELFPSGFVLQPGERLNVKCFIFVPNNEIPERKGHIIFSARGTGEHIIVDVHVFDPNNPKPQPVMNLQQQTGTAVTENQQRRIKKQPSQYTNRPTEKRHENYAQKLQQDLDRLESKVKANNQLLDSMKAKHVRKNVTNNTLNNSSETDIQAKRSEHFQEPLASGNTNDTLLLSLFHDMQTVFASCLEQNLAKLFWEANKVCLSLPIDIAFKPGESVLQTTCMQVLHKVGPYFKNHSEYRYRIFIIAPAGEVEQSHNYPFSNHNTENLAAARAKCTTQFLQSVFERQHVTNIALLPIQFGQVRSRENKLELFFAMDN